MIWPWHRFKHNPFILTDELIVQEAFILNGKKYYQCATAMELAAGRGIQAMLIYDEFRQKCDKEYLDKHIRATELLLKGANGVVTMDHLMQIRTINNNLKERVDLVGMPDHVFKLASVYFWDESESPYYYDYEYNKRKIEEWKAFPDALSFFLTKPLKEYLPFLESDEMNAETYLKIADLIDKRTRAEVQAVLSNLK